MLLAMVYACCAYLLHDVVACFSCFAHCPGGVLIAAAAPVCNLFHCICLRRKDFGDGLDTQLQGSSWLCAPLPPLLHIVDKIPLGNISRVWQCIFFKFPTIQSVAQELIHSAIYLSLKHCSVICSSVFCHILVASFQLECLEQLVPLSYHSW